MFIFFDIDGTLIDQRHAESVAIAAMLDAYGQLLARPYSIAESCRKWRLLREKHARTFFAGLYLAPGAAPAPRAQFFAGPHQSLPASTADDVFDFYESEYRANWKLSTMSCRRWRLSAVFPAASFPTARANSSLASFAVRRSTVTSKWSWFPRKPGSQAAAQDLRNRMRPGRSGAAALHLHR